MDNNEVVIAFRLHTTVVDDICILAGVLCSFLVEIVIYFMVTKWVLFPSTSLARSHCGTPAHFVALSHAFALAFIQTEKERRGPYGDERALIAQSKRHVIDISHVIGICYVDII